MGYRGKDKRYLQHEQDFPSYPGKGGMGLSDPHRRTAESEPVLRPETGKTDHDHHIVPGNYFCRFYHYGYPGDGGDGETESHWGAEGNGCPSPLYNDHLRSGRIFYRYNRIIFGGDIWTCNRP